MTFEEFFKKKKIDLNRLKTAEAELFAEFELHYRLMGAQSFDHTKKYWFNNLRRKYRLPDEPRTEKVKMENQIAEQTVTESITEQAPGVPKVGFKPKFRASAVPPAPVADTAGPADEKIEAEAKPENDAPKLGFKPKFKTAAMPQPTVKTADEQVLPAEEAVTESAAPAAELPKMGFRPKFKPAAAKIAEDSAAIPELIKPPETEKEEPAPQQPETRPAYKPRFQMKNIKPPAEGDA